MLEDMLRYHVAYYLPRGDDSNGRGGGFDFPGVLSQGFDLADARVMVASALKDMAQAYLEEGNPLPIPSPEAAGPAAVRRRNDAGKHMSLTIDNWRAIAKTE